MLIWRYYVRHFAAVMEKLNEFPPKADLRELDIKTKLAISQAVRKFAVWTVAVQGLAVAIIVLLLK